MHDLKHYEAEMVPVKLAIDQWYLRHASPAVDLLVLLALVERFVLRRSVTRLHHRLGARSPRSPTCSTATAPSPQVRTGDLGESRCHRGPTSPHSAARARASRPAERRVASASSSTRPIAVARPARVRREARRPRRGRAR